MSQTFDIGDLVRLSAEFRDIAGALVDPSTVTFKVKPPGGDVVAYVYGTDPEVVRDSVGAFHVDWTVEINGTHWWRFESTGTGQAAAEDSFTARASRLA